MKSSSAATTYARAFLQAADAQKLTASLLPGVAMLAAVMGDQDVALQLGDPRRGPAARLALVDGIAAKLKLPELTANLLRLLAVNKRLGEAGQVLDSVTHLANARAGRVEARVETFAALTDSQIAALKSLLAKKLGASDVVVSEVAAPELIGGFRAFAGGRVWDNSLKGRLSALAAKFNHLIQH